jgi:2',3'-cyclic-nucleotide 2'-phosphodiesterase/3'-nucleotidase
VTGVTTTLVNDHAGGATASDPVPAVRDALAAVDPDREADLRVVVSHCGHEDARIARECGVDLVLGGHVHDHHVGRVGGTLVCRPRPRGEHLLTVALDQGLAATTHQVADVRPDPAAVTAAERLRAVADHAEPVTTVEEPLSRSRADLPPESRAGNLLADAVRAAADADVAVVDAGMLRPGPPLSGTVTAGDCRSLVPFDNDVHATTLSGAALRDLLSNCATPDHGADGGVGAHLGGARVTYRHDPDADTWTLVAARVGDEPLRSGASYTVAAPTFPFHADAFASLSVDRIETTHGDQHAALRSHLRAVDRPPEVEGRVTVEREA